MRRDERKIANRSEIDDIINKSDVCRIAFANDNIPYVIPVSFGYDGKSIYVHTAKTGRKIEFIEKNNRICFEFDVDVKTVEDEAIPCKWTSAYKSVIGYGKMIELVEFKEQENAINQIMHHYSGKNWEFDERMLTSVKLWKIDIDDISGKQSGY